MGLSHLGEYGISGLGYSGVSLLWRCGGLYGGLDKFARCGGCVGWVKVCEGV
jgi:hypothetical protein